MTSHGFDSFFFDLDGVVYLGEDAVPHAVGVLNELMSDWPVGFVTNNASRTPEAIAGHLNQLGVDATPHQIVTSAQAGVALLVDRVPAGSKVFVLGNEGLLVELEQNGFVPVFHASDEPAAVIQGFSPHTGWEQLAEASFLLAERQIPWVATNLDSTFPHSRGTAPGNGSMVAAIRAAIRREPDAVGGKPKATIFQSAMQRFGVTSPLMVGDRMDMDVAGAKNAGIGSALVLTGVHGREQVQAAAELDRPDYVWDDLRQLSKLVNG